MKKTQPFARGSPIALRADLFSILSDLRYSARQFARAPGLSVALLLTIALGIGSSVSIHRFVLGLTRPSSALASMDRVVSVYGQDEHRETGPLSYQDYVSLRNHSDRFEWLDAARISPETIASDGQSAVVSVAAVTPRLANLLNLSLDQGIVLSHRLWQTEFRAKADIRGERLHIDGVDVRVSDVAPDWLEGVYRDRPVDVWIPLRQDSLRGLDNGRRNLWVLGRLRPNVSVDQAQLAVREIHTGPVEIRLAPYSGMTPEMAEGLSRVGTLLGLAAGLVFFIACVNVASFLLGRASARSHEASVRVALGASRGQLTRGLLSDSAVISAAGGALGGLLAIWTLRVLPALLFEQDAGQLVAAPDLSGVIATSAVCVGITIVCGLLPVVAISHDRPATVLRRESAGPSSAIRRLRQALVVAQMTSCCVLVIATAFLFESFHAALQTSVTRRLGNPILVSVQGAGIGYFQEVQRAAQSVAGLSAIAWAGRLPGSLPTWRFFRVEPQQLPLREVTMDIAGFTADSLPLSALPPAAGRFFGIADQTCQAAVVNKEAAAALFGADTVGRSIREPEGLAVDIIGVLAVRSRPTIFYYYPHRTGSPSDPIALAHFRAPTVSKLEGAELDANVVSPSYFAAMGMPLVAGRTFPDDPVQSGCRVGVINEEAADLYFNGKAVGAAVIDDSGLRTRITGVVHATPLGTFEPRMEPAIYFPMQQDHLGSMTLMLGARNVDRPLLEELRSTIEAVPGRGPFPPVVKTLETHLSQTALAPLRIATMIIGASTATAFLLSVLGLFGALSDAAQQRRRELAVRIALGAQRRHVVFQVLKEGGRLASVGALAGTLGSLLLSRVLASIAPGSTSPPPWLWLAAPLVLAAAVVIATVLPARRALLVNPLTIVRDE